jgi:hypothetical protein
MQQVFGLLCQHVLWKHASMLEIANPVPFRNVVVKMTDLS